MQTLLYQLRKEAGMTQKDLAEKLGISETSYRHKELGKSDFKSSEMFAIADIFKRNIGDIFTA